MRWQLGVTRRKLLSDTALGTAALAAVGIDAWAAAQSAGRLKREFQRYLKPAVLIVDELGYLPIDKHGADLLFQIISQRYERAPAGDHRQPCSTSTGRRSSTTTAP